MLFTKVALAFAFAGYVVASPQIVVTQTVVVTVDPPTTSTTTKIVTVTVKPTTSTSTKKTTSKTSATQVIVTITKTVTATKSSTTPITTVAPTVCPVALYYQCGGRNWTGCTKCRDSFATCLSQNEFYYQCTNKPTPTPDARRARMH